MVGIKIVIANPKNGKCMQKELSEDNSRSLYGKKIGDAIHGEVMDLTGYEFKITGGSDFCGFPMRADMPGLGRKKLLDISGIGMKPYKYKIRKTKPFQFHPGSRLRKSVCGNTIHEKIVQINFLMTKEGTTPLEWEKVGEKKEKAQEAAK